MTLVLTVSSRDTLWVLADRRLSYGRLRPPVDDAIKVMELGTTDGVGILAYAGLGATALGTQPSDWMSAVLRGRGGLTFEQALGVLSAAANRELPRHLVRTPGGAHFIFVPAFIRGAGHRLYSIDNIVNPLTGQHVYRYTRHVRAADPNAHSVRMAYAGTGGEYLGSTGTAWQRRLFSLVKAHDYGRVSDNIVANELARINNDAHHHVSDSVGSRCIVIWRRRRDARPGPGGAHQCYTELDREPSTPGIPTIATA